MASSINVTPEYLLKSAGYVDGKIGEYVKQYQKLYSEIDSLANNWKGEGNQAYAKQINSFKVEFENLKKVLDNYVAFLKEASRVYKETEQNIKDGASKLTSGR